MENQELMQMKQRGALSQYSDAGNDCEINSAQRHRFHAGIDGSRRSGDRLERFPPIGQRREIGVE